MSAPTHYPLSWPAGRPRTSPTARKVAKFARDGKWITRAGAIDRLELEIGRLGGRYPLLSTNIETTMRGGLRSDAREPDDRGVCVYFELDGKPYALACDRYTHVADNIAAIAAHIEATRAITRHGVASAAETLQAFQALPSPKQPHEVLGVAADAKPEEIRAAWRRRIAAAHPDQGGSEAAAAELNAARDAMLSAARGMGL